MPGEITNEMSKAFMEQREAKRNGTTVPPPAGNEPPATQQAAAAPPPPAQPAPTFDEAAWLKEKSGGKFESWDTLWQAANKPAETITVQPTYANETSKQIAQLLSEDKELEVLPFLQARKLAKDITSMTPENRVRLHLKEEYGLSDTQVEREYNKLYVPAEDGIDPQDLEIDKKKAARRLENDAATATTYFTKKSEEIKLPFAQPKSAAAPQPTAEQKTVLDFGMTYGTDKISSFPFDYAEPQKGLAVKGTYTLPGDRIAAAKSKISVSPEHFLAGLIASRYYTPDGQVNVDALSRDSVFFDDPASMGSSIAKEALEQTFFQRLQQEKKPGLNGTGGPFLDIADTDKATLYKATRIPLSKPAAVTAPTG